MENERTSIIKIGKKEYELVLTNKATKELNNKFGGLDKIGNKLAEATNVADQLDLVIWLIVLLGNQAIYQIFPKARKQFLQTHGFLLNHLVQASEL